MNDSTRARLERAFEILKSEDIPPILVLTGSTGLTDANRAYYEELAAAACTPNRYVGCHVGAEESWGGYWDAAGELRFRTGDSPVACLWFDWPEHDPEIAGLLVEALRVAGLRSQWGGQSWEMVTVDLAAVPA